MNDPFNSNAPEPRKVGVWTEGAPVETRMVNRRIINLLSLFSVFFVNSEYVMPKKSPDSLDDIPTIPDLDDLQDILEKEISKPPLPSHQDKETVNVLAEVGVGGSVEGIDAALEVLKSFIPPIESDSADTVWTIDSLLTQLAEDEENSGS